MSDEKGLIGFIEWLVARKLAVRTVQQYARHYQLFEEELGNKDLTQGFLDRFVIKHPSNISRSFMKNLFEYFEIKTFEVPKIKGREEVKKRRTISLQEVSVLSSKLYKRGWKYGLMFDLSYYCALRREEIVTLKINDFLLDAYALDPLKPCKLKIHGKGSKERYVMVPPKVMQKLISWLGSKNDIPMDKKLFGVGKSKWHEVFKEAVKKSGSYDYTLHDLRRSRATSWINNGVPMIRVSRRLGHSNLATTQRYINEEEEEELKKWESESYKEEI